MSIDHERFMRAALEEAVRARSEGNSGVGSVIVRDGEVIARGRNLVETEFDVTAHAETVALRQAGQVLRTIEFPGCTLYTTYEPCPMCAGAIMLSGISTLVLGGRLDPERSRWAGRYSVEKIIQDLGMSDRIQIVTGVLQEECEAQME